MNPPSQPVQETERERFERWGRSRQGKAYSNVVEAAWDAWQARAQSSETARLREALELVAHLSSQEWQAADGSRHAAEGNDGKRFWYITERVMNEVHAALASPIPLEVK